MAEINEYTEADVIVDYAKSRLCKLSLFWFVKEFWDVICPDELIVEPHIKILCYEVQEMYERVFKKEHKKYDKIINVPPGTSKTKICSELATAWAFANVPSIRICVGSYTDTIALGISDNIRLVMRSDKYKRYFPDVDVRKDLNNKHEFKTTSKGYFYAFAIGGSITGKHFDIKVVDDPIDPQGAKSQKELIEASSKITGTISQRNTNNDVTIMMLIMQRLAENDPTGTLLSLKNPIYHVCLPAELSENVKPEKYREIYVDGLLAPKRLSASVLAGKKIVLGESQYGCQMMQVAVSSKSAIWKTSHFRIIDDAYFPDVEDLSLIQTHWDTASTYEEVNAANAFISSGKIGHNTYIFDLDFRWIGIEDVVKWAMTLHSPHIFENKSTGISLPTMLTTRGVVAYSIGVKGNKEERAEQAATVANAGFIFIKKSLVDILLNHHQQGILKFPKNSHKDLADALSQMIIYRYPRGVKVGPD